MASEGLESHPPERLAQIASRQLTTLGIAHTMLPDRRAAEGALKFTPGRITNPVSGAPIARARFVTVGHDRVRFLDPPLAALGTFMVLDARTPTEVETAVAVSLLERGAGIEKLRVRLAELKLPVTMDPDALVVRAPVETVECTFELEAAPGAVRVRRLRDPSGVTEVSEAYPTLNLDEFPSRVDLELHLSDALPRLRTAAARPAETQKAKAAAPALVLEPVAAPRGATTLGQLAAKFGPDAYLIPGEQIEVVQAFTVAGATYRFSAIHDVGASFRAKITGPKGVVWQDRIDLERFPGPGRVVSSAVAVPLAAASAPSVIPVIGDAVAGAPTAPKIPAWAVPPHPGEIWVLHATIEARSNDQVRYVCVDPDGHPIGAAQTLSTAEFDRTFVAHGAGFRFRVEIASVEGDSVAYRQLDASGKRSTNPRTLPVATLMSTFVPEATAY